MPLLWNVLIMTLAYSPSWFVRACYSFDHYPGVYFTGAACVPWYLRKNRTILV